MRAPLITPFCFPTWAFSSYCACLPAKAGYQNTHLAMLNSLPRRQAGVFGPYYVKKIPALIFQNELIEAPINNPNQNQLKRLAQTNIYLSMIVQVG